MEIHINRQLKKINDGISDPQELSFHTKDGTLRVKVHCSGRDTFFDFTHEEQCLLNEFLKEGLQDKEWV